MSSESDSDEIETDGFPPESAKNARFTSLKSTNDLGQKLYLPINSWNFDAPSNEIIKNCINALKFPLKISDMEKEKLLEQLEYYTMSFEESENVESVWYSKSSPKCPKSPLKKPEVSKSQSVKINIEIPSSCPSINNIKYTIDQPIYDTDKSCWRTGMDFIFLKANPTILENESEESKDSKWTQTDLDFDSIRESFVLLPKPIGYDTRSRSEEKLIYPDIINLESLSSRLSTNSEFSFLEEFEETMQDISSRQRFSNFQSSFRKYKDGLQKCLMKNIQSIKRLKTESESVMDLSYDKLTESQFKRHAQNQLLLIDVEQEINFLNADINRKDLDFEKITRLQYDTPGLGKLESELRRTRFVKSLRLISQMIANLKSQVSTLTAELRNSQHRDPSFNITI